MKTKTERKTSKPRTKRVAKAESTPEKSNADTIKNEMPLAAAAGELEINKSESTEKKGVWACLLGPTAKKTEEAPKAKPVKLAAAPVRKMVKPKRIIIRRKPKYKPNPIFPGRVKTIRPRAFRLV